MIALGVFFALQAFGIKLDILFDGWWTLFIILPCAIGLFTEKEKLGNAVGLGIGVLLLLACRNLIPFSLIWKLAVPLVLILIGLKMIFGNFFNKMSKKICENKKKEGKTPETEAAVFSGLEVNMKGREFHGAELNGIFGGMTYDLKEAVIHEDCVIQASAVFGGIDIILPENVDVTIHSNSIFGGVSDKRKKKQKEKNKKDTENHKKDAENAELATEPKEESRNPHLQIHATCLFGGIDIK